MPTSGPKAAIGALDGPNLQHLDQFNMGKTGRDANLAWVIRPHPSHQVTAPTDRIYVPASPTFKQHGSPQHLRSPDDPPGPPHAALPPNERTAADLGIASPVMAKLLTYQNVRPRR